MSTQDKKSDVLSTYDTEVDDKILQQNMEDNWRMACLLYLTMYEVKMKLHMRTVLIKYDLIDYNNRKIEFFICFIIMIMYK